MRALFIGLIVACSFFSWPAQAENVKLVCQSMTNNFVVGFGRVLRLSLNMTDQTAVAEGGAFAGGALSRFRETDTEIIWSHVYPQMDGRMPFALDRTTLELTVNNFAPYQCNEVKPQL